MGNSYSSSSTEIIDTIKDIFDENNNNTDNQNNNNNENQTNNNNENKNNNKTVINNNYNNENENNKNTSSERIIDEFLKLEKELRDSENNYHFFGPYKLYTEDKPKNYCISFIYYYPKFSKNSTDYEKLFPAYFHNEITDKNLQEHNIYI